MGRPKDTKGCRVDGCSRDVDARKMCAMHWKRWRKYGDPTVVKNVGRHVSPDGYVKVPDKSGRGKSILEHRLVMEQHLKRQLTKEENVHHINGDRSDNRIENLEIWNTRQPKGQRVPDKIEYALEILEQYAPHLLKEKKCQLDLVG
jgi:hypothetical protein